jgi:hypothetical protein
MSLDLNNLDPDQPRTITADPSVTVVDGWIVDATTGQRMYPVMMEAQGGTTATDLASVVAKVNGAPLSAAARSSSATAPGSPLYWLAALVVVIFALGLFKHRK